ncbi:YicC family protein [Neobacillus notoginsengisoli]|uniref:YicC family protein n=2 Tax=Neobacillus notoginsengisoli TaxID=1578198 RepID=A0A417YQE2_9BACI|nr:YicC/YloC family endoribonuclease [Neobacillus notoginsengisoli]RHW36467.1 YicC family protein [Neobacillus notoginsengisoli]
MVISMTGFGHSKKEAETFSINVEIKTVNHRFCEFSFRMPRYLVRMEEKMKKTLGRHIKRGRAEVHISIDGDGPHTKKLKVDWNLIDDFYRFVSEAGPKYGFHSDDAFKQILTREDFIHIEEYENGFDKFEPLILEALDEAGAMVKEMRLAEGAELKKDLIGNLLEIKEIGFELTGYAPSVVEHYRARLAKRMTDFLGGELDESRLLAESAIFADKSDINEELARLKSHIRQFLTIIEKAEPIGRKLDFLVQEMNREVNTIGSKANDAGISEKVVDMKSLLEKLKEQIQNIE